MITLTCVSNEVGGDLAGNARWQGVRTAEVLAMAKPQAGADCVLSTSYDGFTVTTPLEALTDGRDALLAVAMNGDPLPLEHGFPARMVVPGLYGYVSATKWVVDIDVTRFTEVDGLLADRGWSPQAPIKTASRIDVPAGSPSCRRAAPSPSPASHGLSTAAFPLSRCRSTTATGTMRRCPARSAPIPGGNGSTGGTPLNPERTPCAAARSTATERCRRDQVQGVMPDGATGWDSRQVTVTA